MSSSLKFKRAEMQRTNHTFQYHHPAIGTIDFEMADFS